jgi:hypothetical protein
MPFRFCVKTAEDSGKADYLADAGGGVELGRKGEEGCARVELASVNQVSIWFAQRSNTWRALGP